MPVGLPTGLPSVLIEAFSRRPCAGNGAAVVLLEQPATAGWMQALAGSLRQSETAFLLPHGREWLLRWFTPTCEVRLCGHATLAALLALQHWGRLGPGEATRFHTRSGPLPVALDAADPGLGHLELPSSGLRPAPPPDPLQHLLRRHLDTQAEAFWTTALGYAVALLPANAALAGLGPIAAALEGDLRQGLVLMQAVDGTPEITGSALAAAGSQAGEPPIGYHYQLRFFAPGLGIDEDPVTGSAHALVAPYWLERLGRTSVMGWQCSDRPGGMRCAAGSSGMIRLTGSGYLLWDGTLRAQPQNCGSGWSVAAADTPF
jgi:PhzF family phenazine biosynthesis protein